MANILKGNPYVIDTADAAALTTETLYVRALYYYDAGASAGDSVVVQHASGDPIWEANATGANYGQNGPSLSFPGAEGFLFKGLLVPTLTAGGKLYIYRS